MKQKNFKSESIDDFTDIDGGSNPYDVCVQKKIKGASNSELRTYLKEEGISDEEAREWIRLIDSDYMAGKLHQRSGLDWLLMPLFGVILFLGGAFLLAFQLIMNFVSVWLLLLAGTMVSTGVGMMFYKQQKRKRNANRSVFNQWKDRD
ncbi:MAG: hypothetical protein HUJ25_06795 [Crocinitomicaceae bacterium]|nr:hypothetical protein [Crocinitomicaceae bacterium]